MIRRVHIENFKSLRSVTVDLGPLTVLIGRSGSGKTNFVHALRWLRDVLVTRNADELIGRQNQSWSKILHAPAEDFGPLVFRFQFEVPGFVGTFDYELRFVSSNRKLFPSLHTEFLYQNGQAVFHHEKGAWLHPPQLTRLPEPNGIMLGSLTGLEEASAAYFMLTAGIACHSFGDSVFRQVQNGTPTSHDGLADDGSNFLKTFANMHSAPKTMSRVRDMAASLRVLKPHLKSVDLQLPTRDLVMVTHAINGTLLPLNAADESEGFRRLLACLLALNQEPSKELLIFDEPEKGLSIRALAALAEEFKSHVDRGRGQILLTTHSPELLNAFEPEQIRAVEMDGYETRIGPVAPDQMEALREQFLRPGELLTVDDARVGEPVGAV